MARNGDPSASQEAGGISSEKARAELSATELHESTRTAQLVYSRAELWLYSSRPECNAKPPGIDPLILRYGPCCDTVEGAVIRPVRKDWEAWEQNERPPTAPVDIPWRAGRDKELERERRGLPLVSPRSYEEDQGRDGLKRRPGWEGSPRRGFAAGAGIGNEGGRWEHRGSLRPRENEGPDEGLGQKGDLLKPSWAERGERDRFPSDRFNRPVHGQERPHEAGRGYGRGPHDRDRGGPERNGLLDWNRDRDGRGFQENRGASDRDHPLSPFEKDRLERPEWGGPPGFSRPGAYRPAGPAFRPQRFQEDNINAETFGDGSLDDNERDEQARRRKEEFEAERQVERQLRVGAASDSRPTKEELQAKKHDESALYDNISTEVGAVLVPAPLPSPRVAPARSGLGGVLPHRPLQVAVPPGFSLRPHRPGMEAVQTFQVSEVPDKTPMEDTSSPGHATGTPRGETDRRGEHERQEVPADGAEGGGGAPTTLEEAGETGTGAEILASEAGEKGLGAKESAAPGFAAGDAADGEDGGGGAVGAGAPAVGGGGGGGDAARGAPKDDVIPLNGSSKEAGSGFVGVTLDRLFQRVPREDGDKVADDIFLPAKVPGAKAGFSKFARFFPPQEVSGPSPKKAGDSAAASSDILSLLQSNMTSQMSPLVDAPGASPAPAPPSAWVGLGDAFGATKPSGLALLGQLRSLGGLGKPMPTAALSLDEVEQAIAAEAAEGRGRVAGKEPGEQVNRFAGGGGAVKTKTNAEGASVQGGSGLLGRVPTAGNHVSPPSQAAGRFAPASQAGGLFTPASLHDGALVSERAGLNMAVRANNRATLGGVLGAGLLPKERVYNVEDLERDWQNLPGKDSGVAHLAGKDGRVSQSTMPMDKTLAGGAEDVEAGKRLMAMLGVQGGREKGTQEIASTAGKASLASGKGGDHSRGELETEGVDVDGRMRNVDGVGGTDAGAAESLSALPEGEAETTVPAGSGFCSQLPFGKAEVPSLDGRKGAVDELRGEQKPQDGDGLGAGSRVRETHVPGVSAGGLSQGLLSALFETPRESVPSSAIVGNGLQGVTRTAAIVEGSREEMVRPPFRLNPAPAGTKGQSSTATSGATWASAEATPAGSTPWSASLPMVLPSVMQPMSLGSSVAASQLPRVQFPQGYHAPGGKPSGRSPLPPGFNALAGLQAAPPLEAFLSSPVPGAPGSICSVPPHLNATDFPSHYPAGLLSSPPEPMTATMYPVPRQGMPGMMGPLDLFPASFASISIPPFHSVLGGPSMGPMYHHPPPLVQDPSVVFQSVGPYSEHVPVMRDTHLPQPHNRGMQQHGPPMLIDIWGPNKGQELQAGGVPLAGGVKPPLVDRGGSKLWQA